MRVIYTFKEIIYQHRVDMMCSKESAYILLEVCNNSLEDSEKKLTLFFHLDSFLEESGLV